MALRDSARFEFAPVFARVIVNNPDGSSPSISNVLSGVGPFDFSSAPDDAAVPIIIKIDNANAVNETLDLSGVSDINAVTPAEFIAAYNLVTVGPGPVSGTTASVVNGRVKIAKTTVGTSVHLQVYGLGAELAGFGYGYGAKIVKVNTQQSVADAPNQKESERLTLTDSNGLDTVVITKGYRTGTVYTLVDTAMDQELRAVMEGGWYDATDDTYTAPTSKDEKATFTFEFYSKKYIKDDNLEANLVGYLARKSRSCVGVFGERAGDRNLQTQTYTITATPYKDPATLVVYGDTVETNLTVAAYEALDVLNV